MTVRPVEPLGFEARRSASPLDRCHGIDRAGCFEAEHSCGTLMWGPPKALSYCGATIVGAGAVLREAAPV
ncbi:protein of unknown function [Methylorubrum extorquens]|uniref:Uncharacterized protein n=1 Tax=Methylorubrum extorquens TaxID=408 RepID=A0A2N9AQB3_METEX|nr:protein of unknown function [Methylorubrum extorquens]